MPLVAAKCTQCGATLNVDNSQGKTICPMCHTEFITEQAINNYISQTQVNIGNVGALIVNDVEKEKLLASANKFMELNLLDKARDKYQKICDDFPSDFRGWWGVVQIDTHNFSTEMCSMSEYKSAKINYNRALTCASPEEQVVLMQSWNPFEKVFMDFIEKKQQERSVLVGQNAAAVKNSADLKRQIFDNKSAQTALSIEISKTQQKKKKPKVIFYIIAVILAIVGIAAFHNGVTVIFLIPVIVLVARIIILSINLSIKNQKLSSLQSECARLSSQCANEESKAASTAKQIRDIEALIS